MQRTCFAERPDWIVSIKYHSSMVNESDSILAPVMFLLEFENPRHKFDRRVGLPIFRAMGQHPKFWTSLTEACA